MTGHRLPRRLAVFGILLIILMVAPVFAAAATTGLDLGPDTELYVVQPNQGARKQLKQLEQNGSPTAAGLIRDMIRTPQAAWFTQGTPSSVKKEVQSVVKHAARQNAVPVLVAYNLPFRDCAQFSAGGATTVQEYKDWIRAFAAGIGNNEAIVILEPDGLGIIPWYKQFRGLPAESGSYEWCQPSEADEATTANDRFDMLNYAVSVLKAKPNAHVYLDGTHSSWLGAGDAAHRLSQAGVANADGFFLNVSNYRLTEHLEKYGDWVSKCLWFATDPGSWGLGHFDWCASQYYPANPNDFSTWHLTDQWYTDNAESQGSYPGVAGLKTFVIDTSRNGQGPWTPPAGYPDPQDWCNPPGRGLGRTPTTDTGNEMIDAYLWIKIPGESDGECTRGLGPAGTTVDPEWGIIDPGAGEWFPQMALELARNANP